MNALVRQLSNQEATLRAALAATEETVFWDLVVVANNQSLRLFGAANQVRGALGIASVGDAC